MIRFLRLPSLAVAALLLFAQGSARVLLECVTTATAATSAPVPAMTKHDSAPRPRHDARRTHTGASQAGHEHGQAGDQPEASTACEPADAPCAPGEDDAGCELMFGCTAPADPSARRQLAIVSVAAAVVAGQPQRPHWTDREPETPPPRG